MKPSIFSRMHLSLQAFNQCLASLWHATRLIRAELWHVATMSIQRTLVDLIKQLQTFNFRTFVFFGVQFLFRMGIKFSHDDFLEVTIIVDVRKSAFFAFRLREKKRNFAIAVFLPPFFDGDGCSIYKLGSPGKNAMVNSNLVSHRPGRVTTRYGTTCITASYGTTCILSFEPVTRDCDELRQ